MIKNIDHNKFSELISLSALPMNRIQETDDYYRARKLFADILEYEEMLRQGPRKYALALSDLWKTLLHIHASMIEYEDKNADKLFNNQELMRNIS